MTEPVYEAVAWIYKMLITFIVAAVSIGIIATSIVNDVNTKEVQAQLVLNRILYTPDGFWYKVNGQTIPGIIDEKYISDAKVAQALLNTAFLYKEGYVGAQITIIPKDSQNPKQPFSPLYIDQTTWNALYPSIKAAQKRSGSYEAHNFPVIVRSETYVYPAIMKVEIVLREQV